MQSCQPRSITAACASRITIGLAEPAASSDNLAMNNEQTKQAAQQNGLDRALALFPKEVARAIALAREQSGAAAQWPLTANDPP